MRLVKNTIFTICIIFLAPFSSAIIAKPTSTDNELVFLTWSEYIAPDVVAEFEKTRNAKVRFVYFQSDDARDRLILDNNGTGFDVVLMSGMPMNTYVNRAWLAPITEKDVPNLKHIAPKWLNAFDGANNHAVPYFWGTVGIAYRSDLIKEKITSWKQLFNPPETIGKKIAMIDSGREVIGMALKALGYSINTTDIKKIKEAEKLLHQQQRYVKGYSYINITEHSSLVSGETSMALAYNGDALALQELESNVKFVIPEEGSMLWVDYLTVMASSRKKALAYDFINFLNEPENASKLALYTYYATPHLEAAKQLPKEYLEDPAIYPPQHILDKSETEKSLTPRALKEYGRIMAILIRK